MLIKCSIVHHTFALLHHTCTLVYHPCALPHHTCTLANLACTQAPSSPSASLISWLLGLAVRLEFGEKPEAYCTLQSRYRDCICIKTRGGIYGEI